MTDYTIHIPQDTETRAVEIKLDGKIIATMHGETVEEQIRNAERLLGKQERKAA